MLRQIVLGSIVISGLSFVSMPSAQAHGTFQQCLDKAAKEHRQNLAAGMSRTVADAVWNKAVNDCRRIYKKASVDGFPVATSVPRRDRPSPRRLPFPGGEMVAAGVGETVQNPRECDSGVATLNDNGTWTCQSGDVKLVSLQLPNDPSPAPGCRVIGRRPDGRVIIGCGEIAIGDSTRLADTIEPSPNGPGAPTTTASGGTKGATSKRWKPSKGNGSSTSTLSGGGR